jgi:hypothetical protein
VVEVVDRAEWLGIPSVVVVELLVGFLAVMSSGDVAVWSARS